MLVQEAAKSGVQVSERGAWNEPDMPTIGQRLPGCSLAKMVKLPRLA
jgi:hypothetical protein